ncbi:MAG: hypothetical protein V7K47_02450 [Nostoc sp.]
MRIIFIKHTDNVGNNESGKSDRNTCPFSHVSYLASFLPFSIVELTLVLELP